MNEMKKIIPFLVLALMVVASCADYKKLEVEDVTLASFKLKNTSTAEIVLAAEVNNPSKKNIFVESADGVIVKEGKDFAFFELVGKPKVQAASKEKVHLFINVKIADPLALIATGLDMSSWREDEFMLNAKIVMRREGASKAKFNLKNIPVSRIIDTLNK